MDGGSPSGLIRSLKPEVPEEWLPFYTYVLGISVLGVIAYSAFLEGLFSLPEKAGPMIPIAAVWSTAFVEVTFVAWKTASKLADEKLQRARDKIRKEAREEAREEVLSEVREWDENGREGEPPWARQQQQRLPLDGNND